MNLYPTVHRPTKEWVVEWIEGAIKKTEDAVKAAKKWRADLDGRPSTLEEMDKADALVRRLINAEQEMQEAMDEVFTETVGGGS